MARPVLQVANLEVIYGRAIRAVKGVSLSLTTGSICVIIGANGAGKSSVIRSIAGLVKCSAGDISFPAGESIVGLAPHIITQRGMALVPEGRQIFATLTVEENLRMGAYLHGPSASVSDTITSMYGRFPILRERRKQLAGTLSGGEQQMLAIARALMSNPRVLLMDEPSLGLAPIIVAQLFELTLEIKDTGVSILMAEQNARLALQVADYAYLLEHGEIVREGPARDMEHDSEVRAAYLGA